MIRYASEIETPVGTMTAVATEEGVCILNFSALKNTRSSGNKDADLLIMEENDHLRKLKMEIGEYFEGKRKEFTVTLRPEGTEFQKKVWSALIYIPFGNTISYMDLADILGNKGSIRAAANANARNPVAILIPCHRVIGENGKLTGYAGGLWRKRWLLEHEKRYSGEPVSLRLF